SNTLINFNGTATPWGAASKGGKPFTVELSDGITSISDKAFYYCLNLDEVIIPDSVSSIGQAAFQNCTKLGDIILPEGLEVIKGYTFASNSSMKSVYIPSSLQSVAAYAFNGCGSLANVYYEGTENQWDEIQIANYNEPLLRAARTYGVSIPYITLQTEDLTVHIHDTTRFDTDSFGRDITYQWEYSENDGQTWIVWPNGNSTSIEFESEERMNHWLFRVMIEDASGNTAFSDSALLTVIGHDWNEPVWIWTEDYSEAQAKFVCANDETHTEIVDAFITEEVIEEATYDKDGLKRYTASVFFEGEEYVDIKEVSYAVELSVPVITEHPSSVTVKAGESDVAFTVVAQGEELQYQWYFRTSSAGTWAKSTASFATTDTYSLPASSVTKGRNGYQYYCEVSNPAGSVNSEPATLTIIAEEKPVITTQPQSQTVSAGTATSFKVVATGTNLKYQWYYRTSSTGTWAKSTAACATTDTYTLTASQVTKARSGYQYRCVITDGSGNSVTSNTATLTVTSSGPTITTQPKSQTVSAGTATSFKVVATGTNLKYQWY
ncbi:MAG: leucine-rich repeat protein, partial [Erysipelotrichales bacterium]|nr:leucine-rich repeat protein [Erysipelotrichales bacterium]